MGDFKAASSAFERGLKLEPANASLKSGLQNAKARITDDESEPEEEEAAASARSGAAPNAGLGNLGGISDILQGMGMGGPGGGGMPDIASMMRNPQLMAMAQQMAANGGLESLMQNPAVANMVCSESFDYTLSMMTHFLLDGSRPVRRHALNAGNNV